MAVETKSGALRVAVVEDVRDSREALVFLINHEPDMTCAAAVASAEEALNQFPGLQPDVVLLDVNGKVGAFYAGGCGLVRSVDEK